MNDEAPDRDENHGLDGPPANPDADLSDSETQALLRWVGQGNTLLLCSRHITGLHRALSVLVTQDVRAVEEEMVSVIPEAAGGYAQAIEITGEPGKLPHPCRQTADMRTLP